MSVQPTGQIGGSTSKSSFFQGLRGSFSLGSVGGGVGSEVATTPNVPETLLTPSILVEEPLVPILPVEPDEPVGPLEPETPEEALTEVQDVQQVIEEVADNEVAPTEVTAELDSLLSAVPMAVDAMTDTLNPPEAGGGTAKETPMLSVTVEHPTIDQSGGVQYVENERIPEMPPDVEGFLQKVEDNVDQIPQEIVIADLQNGQQLPRVLATPVIILPITPKTEVEGKKKSEGYSIRWLIEWSWKMMKVFSGKVIYRDESPES